MDLDITPEEHALRDHMPGWIPCRPLTEAETAWADSPHPMRGGGFFAPGKSRGQPVIPSRWIADWPEPGPLQATGVPRGWWWRPADPAHFGAWLVLGTGGVKGNHFFTLVTAPMTLAQHGSVPEQGPIRSLYDALRSREAKKRGVEPASIEHESAALARAGRGSTPSLVAQAMREAERLSARDDIEGALQLLEVTLDDGAGSGGERLRGKVMLGQFCMETGAFSKGARHFTDARDIAISTGHRKAVAVAEEMLALVADAQSQPGSQIALVRALASFKRGVWPSAITRLEAVLDDVSLAPADALSARWRLAVALSESGDRLGAQREASRALKLATEQGADEIAARMDALVNDQK